MTDLDIDAEVPADDVDGQADLAVNRLLRGILDPAVRWQVAAKLKEQLPWVMALSGAQIVAGGVSVEDAAAQLGVTRQYLNRLMADHDQPTPRKARLLAESQEYRYGELLALYDHIAVRSDQVRAGRGRPARYPAQDQCDKLVGYAQQSTRAFVKLAEDGARWLRDLPAVEQESLRREIDACRAAVGELPPYLDIVQQGRVLLGSASAKVARRRKA